MNFFYVILWLGGLFGFEAYMEKYKVNSLDRGIILILATVSAGALGILLHG